MSGGVQVTGLDELRRMLTNASTELTEQARAIVRETTEGAASEMAHRYPARTGKLRRRVKTVYPASAALVGIALSDAGYSSFYEYGTRRRRTRSGANRGEMPAASPGVVVPIAQRWRARMFERLRALVRSHGFEVSS
jgi:hypothetical protein